MMIIDLIDELDVIEGIHKQVPSLTSQNTQALTIKALLELATQQATSDEWQNLNLWLQKITQDISILLPEIKQALTSHWQGDRSLSPELAKQIGQ